MSRSARVQPDWVDLAAVVRDVSTELSRDQQLALGRIALDIPEATHVWFDRAHLIQILNNLLGNAVRYASEAPGAIEVVLDRESHGVLTLSVTDDGPGIASEYRDKLFEPFFTTYRKGTGLGLYLARELALANTAELSFEPLKRRRASTGASFVLRMRETADFSV